ncbi:MAG: SPOR domain-containing protein [Novosphingobium sp.]
MRFEVAAGVLPQTVEVRISEPGSGAACSAEANVQSRPVSPEVPPPPAKPDIAIPAGLYTVNLLSSPGETGGLNDVQRATLEGSIAYETQYEREGQHWHRLRLGFFETREAAEAEVTRLAAQFPGAWVVKVTAQERAQGVATRIDTGAPVKSTAPPTTATLATPEEQAETASLINTAEEAIKNGENDRAVQLLTNALAKPENENTPRALELLGLTRERKGQLAHARAEYEEYLRRYPSGEASDRVRQRLAAVMTPGAGQATPELRQASGRVRSATAWKWATRGSFSEFYFRDQSTTKNIDASRPPTDQTEPENSINLNQLLSSADLTVTGGNDRHQIQIRAAGAYTADFRPNGKDIKSLTAFYLDYTNSAMGFSTRIGRQTRNSAGVLGRFDGALVGLQARPNLRLNAVAGFPVITSRQLYILRDRFFYGASVDYGGRRDAFQATLYWFDQRARGGFIDRRSVGLEARFLKPRFNAFTIVDYDVKYKKLNLGLLTLNYSFPDNSNISITADYRQSPLLTTSNALIGLQVAPLDQGTGLPIYSLDANGNLVQRLTSAAQVQDLLPYHSKSEIYDLALARTYLTKSITATYSRPITKKLQANFDFTLTDTGGTPAIPAKFYLDVNGQPLVPNPANPDQKVLLVQEIGAVEPTGKEYYYGAQLVGSGLFWQNDIYILSGRYANSQRSRTYTIDFNARVPITNRFRLSPRLRYGYRTDKFMDSTFRQFQPTLRFNYYPMRNSEIEIEMGANFNRQRSVFNGALNTTRETGYVASAGFRIDF